MLTIYPDQGPTIAEAFAQLGNGETHIHLTPGRYGAAQGVYRIDGPPAPPGQTFIVTFDEGAVIDFGATYWTDMFAPGGGYRQIKLGRGYTLEGDGVIRNGGGMLLMTDGGLTLSGLVISCFAGLGVQELATSRGSIEVDGCRLSDIGVDPVEEDPIWQVVGRVPIGTLLQGGGMTYDVHDAVARAGLSRRIVYADEPDIVDSTDWPDERLMMYYLCKHLGHKGEGLKALYLSGGAGYRITNNEFDNISGHAIFSKGTSDLLIAGNSADGCASLYQTWQGATGVRVENNVTRIRIRHVSRTTNGLGSAYGFSLNSAEAPVHAGNRWEYVLEGGVYAYRLWNDSPLPEAVADQVFTADGSPVPIYGGGMWPAEPTPAPGLVVVNIYDDGTGLDELHLYREVPVGGVFRGPGPIRMAVQLSGFADLTLRDWHVADVTTPRTDGQAALVIDQCKRVRIEGFRAEDLDGAALYVGPRADGGLCQLDIEGFSAERLTWNAANLYKVTGVMSDATLRTCNQGANPGWDTGAVKITRSKDFAFVNYDSRYNTGPDLWIDHANDKIVVQEATVSRVICEKSTNTLFVDCDIEGGAPDPVQLRGAPDTTFHGCAIRTWGKEKIVIAGNTPEMVDGEEYLTTGLTLMETKVYGQRFTPDDPFNFRFSEGSISREEAKQQFYDTLDASGLTFIEIAGPPVEPPEPPVDECNCTEALDALRQEIAALRVLLLDVRERQDRPLRP